MSVVDRTVEWLTTDSHWSGPDGIPHRILQHVEYSALALGIAAAIAIPIGLWIGHTGRWRGLAIAFTGAMRALPTLGVLTFVVLWEGIGLTPAITALVVLAIPPILAGTYAGIESVDHQTVDAARAMGMTERQVLLQVEIPLARALIIGGLRSATLQVVATATVAAYIGLGGLGRFIFDGQAVQDYPQMAAGSVVVIVLAVILDACFAIAQRRAVASTRIH